MLDKINEILGWEQKEEANWDTKFVELGLVVVSLHGLNWRLAQTSITLMPKLFSSLPSDSSGSSSPAQQQNSPAEIEGKPHESSGPQSKADPIGRYFVRTA